MFWHAQPGRAFPLHWETFEQVDDMMVASCSFLQASALRILQEQLAAESATAYIC